jgi:hypothetical protein
MRWWPAPTPVWLPVPGHATSASSSAAPCRLRIGGTLQAALAADWLVSAWDQCAAFHSLSPAAAAIEEVTSAWILGLLGLSAAASVGFVTGRWAHVNRPAGHPRPKGVSGRIRPPG